MEASKTPEAARKDLEELLAELPPVGPAEMAAHLGDSDPLMRKAARSYFSTARETTSPRSIPSTQTEKT